MKNVKAKAKLFVKQYGLVYTGTYLTLNLVGLAGFYVAFDSGLVASDVSLVRVALALNLITGSKG